MGETPLQPIGATMQTATKTLKILGCITVACLMAGITFASVRLGWLVAQEPWSGIVTLVAMFAFVVLIVKILVAFGFKV